MIKKSLITYIETILNTELMRNYQHLTQLREHQYQKEYLSEMIASVVLHIVSFVISSPILIDLADIVWEMLLSLVLCIISADT